MHLTFVLFALFSSHFLYLSIITSIRVKDLKDPAQLLFRSAHHHGKLRLNAGPQNQNQNFEDDYRHVLSKVHASTVVLVEHAVH